MIKQASFGIPLSPVILIFFSICTGRMLVLIVGCVVGMIFICAGVFRIKTKSRQHQSSFIRYMLGLPLEPKFTKVTWEWKDPHVVGESMSFFLKVGMLEYMSKVNI